MKLKPIQLWISSGWRSGCVWAFSRAIFLILSRHNQQLSYQLFMITISSHLTCRAAHRDSHIKTPTYRLQFQFSFWSYQYEFVRYMFHSVLIIIGSAMSFRSIWWSNLLATIALLVWSSKWLWRHSKSASGFFLLHTASFSDYSTSKILLLSHPSKRI